MTTINVVRSVLGPHILFYSSTGLDLSGKIFSSISLL